MNDYIAKMGKPLSTPKPRAGEQFRRIPDVIAQLEADNAALRERERELVEALRELLESRRSYDNLRAVSAGESVEVARDRAWEAEAAAEHLLKYGR